MTKSIFSTVLLSLLAVLAFAQDRTVKGVVQDADGPLPGVSVVIKGTTQGTVTGLDGDYSLNVPSENTVLEYHFIGYKTQEVNVAGRSTINVMLEMDVEEMEEVEIVGYTKKDVSSSTPKVENVTDVVAPNMANAMQGKAAGINITPTTGQPGAKANIRIRGVGSISAGTDPLYVIDGVIVSSDDGIAANQQQQRDPLSSINPQDILDIKILKDAAATALYGSRAANGVILVTTKRGQAGKPQISLSAKTGISQVNKGNFKLMDGKQFSEFHNVEWNGVNTDWTDEAFRQGTMQSYDLSMSGGNDKTRYYVSGGYFNQEGILIGSEFERYSMRMNLDQKVNDKLSVSLNSSLSYVDQLDASNGNLYSSPLLGAYLQAPIINPFDENGDPRSFLAEAPVGANFIHDTPLNERRTKSLNGILDGKINYQINDWLSASNTTSMRFESAKYNNYNSPLSYDGRASNGDIYQANLFNSTLTSTSLLNFDKTFGMHNLSALAGYEYQVNNREVADLSVSRLPGDLTAPGVGANIDGVGGFTTAYKYMSYLSQLSYNYDGKYYASASYRRDGSSRFAADNRWGNFYSVGASWFISREEFMSNSDFDLAKLRVSYGTTGNANIDNFEARGLYGISHYDKFPAAFYEQAENKELSWETREKLNAGFDLGYKGVVTLNADFYVENSKDLLMQAPLPSTTGLDFIRQNVGQVQNRGIELQLSTKNVQTGDFSWTTDFNIAYNENEVIKLDDQSEIVSGVHILKEGSSMYTFYLREFAGANPANGKSSWYVNKDLSAAEAQAMVDAGDAFYAKDGRLATSEFGMAERVESGSALPTFTGGITNTFKYKNFDLSVFMTFATGNKIYNGTRRFTDLHDGAVFWPVGDGQYSGYAMVESALTADRWSESNPDGYLPAYGTGATSFHSDRILEDGSYLSLRNVTLGYTLPKTLAEKLHVSNLRVFASAQNLYTLTNYTGYSPVTVDTDGYNFFEYPEGRMFSAGLNMNF
ncbi:TonB-dependent receptor [Algivirga pacifica]|uniref:TonB-dependent receptor n=1 Tax=Algivirga pacifica TaxID=1162670 RepID=A0ABP9D137_9BACT